MDWATMSITAPIKVRVDDGVATVDVVCGLLHLQFTMPVHILLASIEEARREVVDWQGRANGNILLFAQQ